MIVVDTNVWSEATKRDPSPIVRAWAARHEGSLWLSAIVLAELRAGTGLMPVGERRRSLEMRYDLLEDLYADRLVAFDHMTARFYADVLASARHRGKPIATADAMIAATALQHGAAVATRDVNDFAGASVTLLNPWQA